VHVEGAGVAIVAVAPNTIQKLLPGDHTVRAARQGGQESELFVSKLYLRSLADHPDIVEIDEKTVVLVGLARVLVGASHDGPHARQ
jgi:hypothetical protein